MIKCSKLNSILFDGSRLQFSNRSKLFLIIYFGLFTLTAPVSNIVAQTFIPGEVYFDSTQFVEYRAGNLPIILSAPHGGGLRPDSIPDRKCDECVTTRDAWTQTITKGVHDAIVAQTGCYPHTVINLLHRVKFDANRDIEEAALGIPFVQQAWRGYHQLIDSAKARVKLEYDRGLFLDVHGHAHVVQRIELGYLISKSELQLSDEELDAEDLINESSVKTLVSDNQNQLSHSALLRGEQSLGTLLTKKGFPAVPSLQDPFPLNEDAFFSGGFNTIRHGSRDKGGPIDAIQIELNQDIRFDEERRDMLIDSLATIILDYIDLHYDDQFREKFCDINTNVADQLNLDQTFAIYPNPTNSQLNIRTNIQDFDAYIINPVGQIVYSTKDKQMNLSFLPAGYYMLHLKHSDLRIATRSFILY